MTNLFFLAFLTLVFQPATPIPKEFRVLDHQEAGFLCLAFSPDGKVLATGGEDKLVRLWEIPSGKPLGALKGHATGVLRITFSPDGRFLLSAGEYTVRVWDPATMKNLAIYRDTWNTLPLTVSPDSTSFVSGGEKGSILIIDIKTGKRIQSLQGHAPWTNSAAFTPNGNILVTGGQDKTIKVWDLVKGTELRTLTGHESFVASVAISPDGRLLASGSTDKTVRLWDIAKRKEIRRFEGDDAFSWVAFSPDGSTLGAATENKVIFWELPSCQKKRVLTITSKHLTLAFTFAFSPDGEWLAVTSSGDGTVRLWKYKDVIDWSKERRSGKERKGDAALFRFSEAEKSCAPFPPQSDRNRSHRYSLLTFLNRSCLRWLST